MSDAGHAHWWKRLPVTDFTVTYECDCGQRVRVIWGWFAGSVSHVDAMVTKERGGTVRGDAGQPFEYCLAGRMIQVRDLGLDVPAEDLRTDPDAE